MVSVFSWNMARSLDELRTEFVGAEIFGRFLEESYDVKDLLFYLHARSSVKRVLRLDPRNGWIPIGNGLPNRPLEEDRGVQSVGKAMPRTIDAQLAIRIVRDCVASKALQDRVFLERLDPWMKANSTVHIDIDSFLQMLTEEYHNSRADFAIPGDILDHVQEAKVSEFLGWIRFALGGDLQAVFNELDMDESGITTRSEFVTMVNRMGYRGDASEIWEIMDRSATGQIGRREFLALGGASLAEIEGSFSDEAGTGTNDEISDEDIADGDHGANGGATCDRPGLQRMAKTKTQRSKRAKSDYMPDFNLEPEVQREAESIAQRLEASLQANKLQGIRKQETYAWAAQIALRRHSMGPRGARAPRGSVRTQCSHGDQSGYVVSMEVMRKTWNDMYCRERVEAAHKPSPYASHDSLAKDVLEPRRRGGLLQSRLPSTMSESVAGPSADALMEAVHSALYQATRTVAHDAAHAVVVSTGLNARVRDLAAYLLEHLTPVADALLETLVHNDFGEWTRLLQIGELSDDPAAAVKRKLHFDHLRSSYQHALSHELTKDVLLRICNLVLSTEDMKAFARRIAEAAVPQFAARGIQSPAQDPTLGTLDGLYDDDDGIPDGYGPPDLCLRRSLAGSSDACDGIHHDFHETCADNYAVATNHRGISAEPRATQIQWDSEAGMRDIHSIGDGFEGQQDSWIESHPIADVWQEDEGRTSDESNTRLQCEPSIEEDREGVELGTLGDTF